MFSKSSSNLVADNHSHCFSLHFVNAPQTILKNPFAINNGTKLSDYLPSNYPFCATNLDQIFQIFPMNVEIHIMKYQKINSETFSYPVKSILSIRFNQTYQMSPSHNLCHWLSFFKINKFFKNQGRFIYY